MLDGLNVTPSMRGVQARHLVFLAPVARMFRTAVAECLDFMPFFVQVIDIPGSEIRNRHYIAFPSRPSGGVSGARHGVPCFCAVGENSFCIETGASGGEVVPNDRVFRPVGCQSLRAAAVSLQVSAIR